MEKVQKFLDAAVTGKLHLLRSVAAQLDNGKGLFETVANLKDANKRGVLHFAARGGNIEICKYLLEEWKLEVNVRDNDGETPLIHAARQGHTSAAEYLIEHGADPASASDIGATALHHAAGRGHIKLIKILISNGADVNSQSKSGTPLIWAAGHGQQDALKLLIEARAKVNIIAGGETPLHTAANIGNSAMITCLLKAGADANMTDEDGLKPVQVAAARGNRAAVEILLPLTSHVESVQDWTVHGIIKHMQSEVAKSKEPEASTRDFKPRSDNTIPAKEMREVTLKKAAEAKSRADDTYTQPIHPKKSAPLSGGSSYADAMRRRSIPDMCKAILALNRPVAAVQPVSSSKQTEPFKLPQRPGHGSSGTKCLLKANHFKVELSDRGLYLYTVRIVSYSRHNVNLTLDRDVVVAAFVKAHLGSDFEGGRYVFDGQDRMFTVVSIPLNRREGVVRLQHDGSGSTISYNVFIKSEEEEVVSDNMKKHIEGLKGVLPYPVVQAINTVLKQGFPAKRYYQRGASFCSDKLGHDSLGGGLCTWRGFHQSMRYTQTGLSLIIDLASSVFIEASPVIECAGKILRRDILADPPSNQDERDEIRDLLYGFFVEAAQNEYLIDGLTDKSTRELMRGIDVFCTFFYVSDFLHYIMDMFLFFFISKDESECFLDTRSLKHLELPCLYTMIYSKALYLPFEVCNIVKGQRKHRLNGKQSSKRLAVTRQKPSDKEIQIKKTVACNDYDNEIHAKQFGIVVRKEQVYVEARVLSPPQLQYHKFGRENICVPVLGQWDMNDKEVVDGGNVNKWICVNFDQQTTDAEADIFCKKLAHACNDCGMIYGPEPVHPPIRGYIGSSNQTEKALKHAQSKLNGTRLDLLVVILPNNNGNLYGEVKRICETEIGVVSQCCRARTAAQASPHKLANMALKINVKVGGRNTVLSDALKMKLPNINTVPTIIFGADVTHNTRGRTPSIAAVVATQDWPQMTKYAVLFRAQNRGDDYIRGLFEEREPLNMPGGMIREHLINYRRATGHAPQRIIFYRDGGSEGNFESIVKWELEEIRKACDSLPQYKPDITFIAVQKRHHTRLFAEDHNDKKSVDKTGNILPGTVVDSQICHPTGYDFFLCSHAGYQGTSRPSYYHVLHDDNNFKPDDLQLLTYYLCYTYARGTRATSIVPPVGYAHNGAYRARFYLGPGPGGTNTQQEAVTVLPPLKENVKKLMFYC